MNYHVSIGGVTRVVAIRPDGVTVDGHVVDAEWVQTVGSTLSGRGVVRVDDSAETVVFGHRNGDAGDPMSEARWLLSVGGVSAEAVVLDDRQQTIREMVTASAGAKGPQPIKAPMPGMVVKVEVAPGDRVQADQGIVVVEAMKMENELLAQSEGVVSKVHVVPGQAVEKDQILVEFDG